METKNISGNFCRSSDKISTWQQGANARRAGVPLANNPWLFRRTKPMHYENWETGWRNGWLAVDEMLKEQERMKVK